MVGSVQHCKKTKQACSECLPAGTSATAMAGSCRATGLLSEAAVTQVRDENNPTLVNIKQKLISIESWE